MLSFFLGSPVQGFVAAPQLAVGQQRSCGSGSAAVTMSLDRRAALSGAASALFAMAGPVSAATTLKSTELADEAELDKASSLLKAEDAELAQVSAKELADSIAIKKTELQVLDAMQKGDEKLTKTLQAKLRALKSTEAADEKTKLALTAEVRKEASIVAADKAKVSKDVAAETKEESKEILQAEESALKEVEGEGTFSVVSKFFKQ